MDWCRLVVQRLEPRGLPKARPDRAEEDPGCETGLRAVQQQEPERRKPPTLIVTNNLERPEEEGQRTDQQP